MFLHGLHNHRVCPHSHQIHLLPQQRVDQDEHAQVDASQAEGHSDGGLTQPLNRALDL
jgi:hypothetical protein